MRYLLSLFFIIILQFLYTNYSFSEETTELVIIESESEGTGVVIQDNKAVAREEAINDAMRNAVEKTATNLLDIKDIVINYEELNNIFYTKSPDFIQRYKVLSEFFDPSLDQYTIKITASIYFDALKKELSSKGLLVKRTAINKVLILISSARFQQEVQSNIDLFINIPLFERIILNNFKDKGATIIDRFMIKTCGEESLISMVLEGDESSAITVGELCNADIVVIGNEKLEVKDKKDRVFTVEAVINSKILSVSTGEIIAEGMESSTVTEEEYLRSARRAAQNAGNRLARYLISNLTLDKDSPDISE